jgi:translocation and assembly module TamB
MNEQKHSGSEGVADDASGDASGNGAAETQTRDQTAARTPPRRRRFSLLGLLWRLMLQLLILILLLLGLVLGTQTGLRVAIAVAQDLAPGMIEVGGVDGRILGELRLHDLTLNLPGLALELGRLHLDWSPWELLRARLRIAELSASDLHILVEPGPEKEPEPFELPQIELPIGIDIGQVLVERLSFNQTGAAPESAVRLERAELSATAVGDRIDLRRLYARMAQPQIVAEAKGNARLTGDHPLDLDLHWQFKQAPALALIGDGKIDGDLARLSITHRITGSADVALQAEVSEVLKAPTWEGTIQVNAVQLPEMVADAPSIDLTAELATRGNLDAATVSGSLAGAAPELPEFGALNAELDLLWAGKILSIRALRLNETASGALVDLSGTLDLNAREPAFVLAGVWERLRWPLIGSALVEAPRGKLDVKGDLSAFTYLMQTDARGAQIPETRLVLQGAGDTGGTELESLLVETLGGRIEAKGRAQWTPTVTWDLALNGSGIDPGLHYPGLDGQVALKAESKGGLDDGFGYQLELDAGLSAYPAALLTLSGSGTLENADLESLTIETLGGLIQGKGQVAWAPDLTWKLQLDADDLNPGSHYPGMDGRVAFKLNSDGGLQQGFAYALEGNARLAAYPPTLLDIAGTGGADSTRIETLSIELLDGRINGGAEVAWAPTLSWNMALTLADIDPGKLAADWPGRLGGRIESSGKMTAAGPDLEARIGDLGGELRGYPVRVEVAAAMREGSLELQRLLANSGATRVSANGRIAGLVPAANDQGAPAQPRTQPRNQSLDFRFDFDSPDLGALLPDAKGRLTAKGTLGGTLAAPALTLDLDGRDAELAGQGIEQITGRAAIGLGPSGAFEIDIDGQNLIAGNQRFETLSVQGRGSMAAHRLDLDVSGDQLSLELGAEGGLGDAGAYRGGLNRLALKSAAFGLWSLQRPARYSIDQGRILAGPLCIGNGNDSGGCVEFEQQQPGLFDATLDVPRIGLEILNPLLPELTMMNGFVRADAKFRGEANVISGSARVQVPTGEIQIALADAKDKLVFSGTGADLRLRPSGLEADLTLPLQGVGRVDGKVAVPGFGVPGGADPALRGGVDIRITDLSRVSNLMPDLTNITGGIDGDIQLAGTLGKPDIRGRLALRQIGLNVPLIGLEVAQTNITAEAQRADWLVLNGSSLIGGGRLDIDGNVNLTESGLDAKVELTGDQLKVADSKEYFALLSLDIKAGVGPGGAAVNGEISIPEARIMPRTIPSGAIQPSPDVVTETVEEKEAVPLHIDLLARLGDAVSVDAFGLRAMLRGNLRVTKQPNRGLVGSGQLEVVDGTYRVTIPGLGLLTSIGKPLTIKQGLIVFANTPLDNPGLILNAQREGGDVTAGVRVLGTIRNPKLAFFSESDPNLSQAQITSYLVTGIPPKRNAAGR